tara:strand:- start:707 stop:1123 length:417 start_codon:yes stop_codon:yes gene_type:complete
MKRYEVQTFTLCDGFVNTWSDDDETPVTFDTEVEAQAELAEHLEDLEDAFKRGDLSDTPDPDDYQVMEVYPSRPIYTVEDIQTIADEALNAACRVVQDRLGVTSGDLAAQYFQGQTERVIDDILRGYIRSEIQLGVEQ